MSDQLDSLLGLDEATLRVVAFMLAFITFSTLETLAPKRTRSLPRVSRWLTNGGLLLLSTSLIRLLAILAPILAITTIASALASKSFGFFNWLDLPLWLELSGSLLLLDLAIWFQHLISHKVPLLWRIHRVHHADRDLDSSSALRFHPVEMLLSFGYKITIVCLLGPSALAIVLFEVILNASAMFNHANLSMPRWMDSLMRTVIVTPDMHRIHHSIHRHEHDTNYGFCLSIWDHLFSTYSSEPAHGHAGMTLGLKNHQTAPTHSFIWSLTFPFKR